VTSGQTIHVARKSTIGAKDDMALDCGNNFFSGVVDDTETINPTFGGGVALLTAVSIALAKAMDEINIKYALPCPQVGCTRKQGIYSLKFDIKFKKLRNREEAFCKIEWILNVNCEPDTRDISAPSAVDWGTINDLFDDWKKNHK
jgi:hypothetical protein